MTEINSECWKLFHDVNNINLTLIKKYFDNKKIDWKDGCNELARIVLHEHLFISRQFRLVDIFFINNNEVDNIDHCFILISLCRSLIENLAKVSYFFHDDDISLDKKLKFGINTLIKGING